MGQKRNGKDQGIGDRDVEGVTEMQASVGRVTKSGLGREKWEEARRSEGEEVLVGLLTG